jgi:hypothetical protein
MQNNKFNFCIQNVKFVKNKQEILSTERARVQVPCSSLDNSYQAVLHGGGQWSLDTDMSCDCGSERESPVAVCFEENDKIR